MNPPVVAAGRAVRVLIVDDQLIVREGLRMLLESMDLISVVGEASTREDAMDKARQTQPDVILLDLDLGGQSSGRECLPELLHASPSSRVLVLTGTHNHELHFEAIRLGASGLVHKLEASSRLGDAIRKVNLGEVWLDGSLMADVLQELWHLNKSGNSNHSSNSLNNGSSRMDQPGSSEIPPKEASKIDQLTNREREVIELIGKGMRNQQIADHLFISVITVRHHLSSIFSKLGVGDRFELAIYAYRHGLARIPTI